MAAAARAFLLVCIACAGCAGPAARRATPEQGRELRRVATAVFDAVAAGDEARYRRLVLLPAGDAYSDALTATLFEAVRLHQAAEGMPGIAGGGGGATTGPARFAQLAVPDYRANARAMGAAAAGWTFTVSRGRATIDQLAGSPSAPSLRKVGGRWLLSPTRWDARRDTATYRLAVAEERALADALAAARGAVVDGRARSVEDVNAILRDRLAAPDNAAAPAIPNGGIP